MANFKWVKLNQTLQRLADGACIPAIPGNRDYDAFVKSGEVPDPETVVVPPTPDQNAATATDGISQLIFDVMFNQESRLRVLEAKPVITPAQYRAALIARWKVLNP